MYDGYIDLHRKLRECWVWQNPLYLKAWIDILFSANYKDKKVMFDGKVVTVKRGQFITSQRKLGNSWGCNIKTVRRILEIMEDQEMVTLTTTGRGTLLTVINYDFYQLSGAQNGTQTGTQDGTQMGTQTGTQDGTQTGHNIININNGNNVNNAIMEEGINDLPPLPPSGDIPKKKATPFNLDSMLKEYNWTDEMKELVKAFFDYRKEIAKPVKSEKSATGLLKEIDKEIMESGEIFVDKRINESIRNGWQGIFFNHEKPTKPTTRPTGNERPKESDDFFKSLISIPKGGE